MSPLHSNKILGKLRVLFNSTRLVNITDCYHYRGFWYGSEINNPYLHYVTGLHRRIPLSDLRRQFESWILSSRPKNLAEALGIDIDPSIRLWSYPWEPIVVSEDPANVATLERVQDLLTYFCEFGVLKSRLLEEYGWLERAYTNMRDCGYLPEEKGYIFVRLLKSHCQSSYIVLDGNHRLSALKALGKRTVRVKYDILTTVFHSRLKKWYQVANRKISCNDAEKIFLRYFQKNNTYMHIGKECNLINDA